MTDRKSSDERGLLADRLAAAKQGRFVGREVELDIFRSALLSEKSPYVALHIYGPGGVGKSTLLSEFNRITLAVGRRYLLLDGRNISPAPEYFLEEWHQKLSAAGYESVPDNLVVFIDTYELLQALDDWIRNEFLPLLPSNTLVVFGGRDMPAAEWRFDPGWSELTRIIPLRNLRPEESQTYLAVRGVADHLHADVLAFTHGHPLALSLVVEVLQQGDRLSAFSIESQPDVVQVLLERFTRNIPDGQHRQALEICAHVRVTTEALLAGILGEEQAYTLFNWLRGLSFIQHSTQGLFPHDLARDVLDADLRWRNPGAYQSMHQKIRLYYGNQLRQLGQNSALSADLIYQNRYHTAIDPFFAWETLSQVSMETATPADYPVILEMVERYEGGESAAVARYWLEQQPEGFTIFRTAQDRQMSFVLILNLEQISDEYVRVDPAIAAAQAFLEGVDGSGQPRQTINFVRFWMGREKYQVAETQSLVAMRAGGAWISTPRMSWTFAVTAEAQNWMGMFEQLNFDYTGEADFVVGGHRFGVFTHDWRVESVADWGLRLEALQLGLEQGANRKREPSEPPLVTLSRPDFLEAVRQALRDYTRPDLLASNVLMRSRLVGEARIGSEGSNVLQGLIEEAARNLLGNPKDEKFYDAVFRTYLKPAPSQEVAAELLDLPLGTYRYRLARGVERIGEWLWQRELNNPGE